jgi:hypothetical protein
VMGMPRLVPEVSAGIHHPIPQFSIKWQLTVPVWGRLQVQ